MQHPPKLSIITPSYNSGDFLERAIQSVLEQGYPNVEHIVVDGGSTDQTLEILRRYEHLRWVSEPDEGQADAMRKGFAMCTGDVVGNLNADDLYLPGAFAAVAKAFRDNPDAMMVLGKVRVIEEKSGGEFISNGAVTPEKMLMHWEPDAFCVNPVGYFYRREVGEAAPFNPENDDKQDLEFLLEVAFRYPIVKIDELLGVFNYTMDTKTFRQQVRPEYWRTSNFPFVERLLTRMDHAFQARFKLAQEAGHQWRRRLAIAEAVQHGFAADFAEEGVLLPLPSDDLDRVDETSQQLMARGDGVILLAGPDVVTAERLLAGLRTLPEASQPRPAYMLHPRFLADPAEDCREDACAVPWAVVDLLEREARAFNWKVVVSLDDPVTVAQTLMAEAQPEAARRDPGGVTEASFVEHARFLTQEYPRKLQERLGFNLMRLARDVRRGYSIVRGLAPWGPPPDEAAGAPGVVDVLLILRPEAAQAGLNAFLGVETALPPPAPQPHVQAARGVALSPEERALVTRTAFGRRFTSMGCAAARPCREHCGPSWLGRMRAFFGGDGPAVRRIYDVGLHTCEDTEFYLKKGFTVVAVEANPTLAAEARRRFAAETAQGRLTVLNVGVADAEGEAPFYINPRNTEWSSFSRTLAGADGGPVEEVTVPLRRLSDIILEHGAPYYVKIDIEGHDEIALQSLYEDDIRPPYVSVENGAWRLSDIMALMGYDDFIYVQQKDMARIQPPKPAREGKYVRHVFPHGASGLFGKETPGEWKPLAAVREDIERVWDLDAGAKVPGHVDAEHGWFDLHGRHFCETETKAPPPYGFPGLVLLNEELPPTVFPLRVEPERFAAHVYATRTQCDLLNRAYGPRLFGAHADLDQSDLKCAQDLLAMALLLQNVPAGARILEVGGGHSRLLRHFMGAAQKPGGRNGRWDAWLLDRFRGEGGGPVTRPTLPGVHIVEDYLGAMNSALPEAGFDCVFSISVLEHTPQEEDAMDSIAEDLDRLLKPGGLSFHLVDMTINEPYSWLHPIVARLHARFPVTQPLVPLAQIAADEDLYHESEAAYTRFLMSYTGKTFEEFGKLGSYAFVWRKPA